MLAIRASGVRASHYRAGGNLTVPSLLILGTDAVLAANPATPVQLAHACMAAGFHTAIPASWGDELIAARVVESLRDVDGPRVLCTCPHVSRRLEQHGEALGPMLMQFVPPPVATAMYLRTAYAPTRPHITFAGACPAAAHESIDEWLTTAALLELLAERGATIADQPTEFDSIIPPDRRRYFSDPGGVPNRAMLRQLSTPVEVVEAQGEDMVVEVAQHLLGSGRVLIDPSVSLACSCSGTIASVAPAVARARVRENEPPRAPSPVVDHSVRIYLAAPTVARAEAPVGVAESAPRPASGSSTSADVTSYQAPRRRSTPSQPRPVLGATPLRRSDTGKQLPRAYIARRRSSPRSGVRDSIVRRASSHAATVRWVWIAAAALGVVGLATLVITVLR